MKKALILTWDGFQDQEVIYPYYRVQEEGFEVLIWSNNDNTKGIFGISFPSVNISDGFHDIHDTYRVISRDFDLLIIPGGVKALEKLRQQKWILELIEMWNNDNRIIASTCHGAQMLISAGIVKGRKISGYYSIKDDINNAGATYVDAPAVVDKNIISSPHYKHMGEWMKETFNVYNEKYGLQKCGCH